MATSDSASGAPTEEGPTPAEKRAAGSGTTAAKPVGGLMAAYFVGRFGVFVVLVVICYLVHFRGFPGLIASALVSIPISYFLFRGWRVELAQRMAVKQEQKLRFKEEFKTATD
ncbi:DUF4229 domain-containing protein [Antricoccus suffuscus]|uniref:DUF4229 domain-containing protein n=1 Tax=Antricoccus suffuscus TaxID=1629062 RepID=UPI001475EBEC|nr:DUF4229 domain-containing protein [Antricoccus suffuscus]